jgi:ribosome biogenesis protein MAK21
MPKVAGDDDLLDADAVDVDDDDSQDGGFDFGADDSDPASDVPSSEGEDALDDDEVEQSTTGQDAGADDEEQDDDEADEDGSNLAEGSDAEDLLDLDAEIPIGLISFNGAASDEEAEAEEWGGVDPKSKKRSANGERRAAKRRKLRSLPTFASAEDYAAMIDAEPEDNL